VCGSLNWERRVRLLFQLDFYNVLISKERERKGKNDGKSKFSLFGKGKKGEEKNLVVGDFGHT